MLGAAADAVAADDFTAARSAVARAQGSRRRPGRDRARGLARRVAPARPDRCPTAPSGPLDLIEAPARAAGRDDRDARPASPSSRIWPPHWTLVAARPTLRAVTRDGDLVGAGWVSGGSDRKPSTLEIASEIDKARGELVTAETQVEELTAALAGALGEQANRQDAAEEALAALNESDAAISAIYEQLGRLGQEARAAEGDCRRLSSPSATSSRPAGPRPSRS